MQNTAGAPSPRRRLLVVDDNGLVRQSALRVFGSSLWGWDVVGAKNAEEAKKHYGKVDVALVDWEPAGPEVVAECGCPCVIFTGHPSDPALGSVSPEIPIFEKPADYMTLQTALLRVGGFPPIPGH